MNRAADLAGCEAIRDWLTQRCGIHYPQHKTDLLRQRLTRVQRAFTLNDLGEMARRLNSEANHDLQLAVMHAASTNHTYFFRETEVLVYAVGIDGQGQATFQRPAPPVQPPPWSAWLARNSWFLRGCSAPNSQIFHPRAQLQPGPRTRPRERRGSERSGQERRPPIRCCC